MKLVTGSGALEYQKREFQVELCVDGGAVNECFWTKRKARFTCLKTVCVLMARATSLIDLVRSLDRLDKVTSIQAASQALIVSTRRYAERSSAANQETGGC